MSDTPPATPRDFDNRMGALVDRFMDGGVVVFAGAGVSIRCRNPDVRDLEPTIPWLRRRLIALLQRYLVRADAVMLGALGAELGLASPHEDEDEVGEEANLAWRRRRLLAMAGTPAVSFDRLAEAVAARVGQRRVWRALRITCFAGLRPAPMHRWVARVVREGLLEEVITTNYDCCFERAYEETFSTSEGPKARVSVTLENYRRYGGNREDPKGRPLLHVFKINGCAARSGPAGILLTERQLQSLDRAPWVQDLLRDRSRRSTLFFNGFGSDEPQVRFTMLGLIREFRRERTSNPDPWARENAPFVAAYDRYLSFPQVQLLREWEDAHSGEPLPCEGLHDRANVFTGRDWKDVGARKEATLPADDLWAVLFHRVFLRLLARYTERGAAFNAWLKEQGTCSHERLIADMSTTLLPAPGPKSSGALTALYDGLCAAATGSAAAGVGRWHLAFRDDPLLVPAYCMAVWSLRRAGYTQGASSAFTRDGGARVTVVRTGLEELDPPQSPSRSIVLLTIPATSRTDQRRVRLNAARPGSNPETRAPVRLRTLGLATLLSRAPSAPAGERAADPLLLLEPDDASLPRRCRATLTRTSLT